MKNKVFQNCILRKQTPFLIRFHPNMAARQTDLEGKLQFSDREAYTIRRREETAIE